jgi:hypothetical protein
MNKTLAFLLAAFASAAVFAQTPAPAVPSATAKAEMKADAKTDKAVAKETKV